MLVPLHRRFGPVEEGLAVGAAEPRDRPTARCRVGRCRPIRPLRSRVRIIWWTEGGVRSPTAFGMWSSRREWDRGRPAASTHSVEIGAPEAECHDTDESPCAYPATLVAAHLLMTTRWPRETKLGRANAARRFLRVSTPLWVEPRLRSCLVADPFDPHDKILAGVAHLCELRDRCGDCGFSAADNAGPAPKKRASLPANRRQTSTYVNRLAPAIAVDRVGDGTARASAQRPWINVPLFLAQTESSATAYRVSPAVQYERRSGAAALIDATSLSRRSGGFWSLGFVGLPHYETRMLFAVAWRATGARAASRPSHLRRRDAGRRSRWGCERKKRACLDPGCCAASFQPAWNPLRSRRPSRRRRRRLVL